MSGDLNRRLDRLERQPRRLYPFAEDHLPAEIEAARAAWLSPTGEGGWIIGELRARLAALGLGDDDPITDDVIHEDPAIARLLSEFAGARDRWEREIGLAPPLRRPDSPFSLN